jgi:CBS domain-containing protein
VSIVAKDATVRQILTEWARVGRTKIVNVERIPGGPLTLELKDVPEMEALDVLLRTLSGYMAAPRVSYTPDASQFDAIIVMPTTAPPPSRTAAAVAPAPFAPPSGFPVVDDDQGPPGPGQQPRGPIFSTFPQPQVGAPQQRPNLPAVRPGIPQPQPEQGPQQVQPPVVFPQPATPNAQPAAPFGAVSAPGMIAQPAQQPGQVAQPRRPNDN